VVDACDALTHGRPYKKSVSLQDAKKEIRSQSRMQFDPQVVDAFLSAITPQVFQELTSDKEVNPETTVLTLAQSCEAVTNPV
jgi:HD-GYP domain-containing protein (c-di-GMP phosphodiesterase class II)